jgi:cell division protein FtsB
MLNILKNPLAIIAFTVITLVFYISLSETQQKSHDTLARINDVQQEKQYLEEKNQDLEEKLQNIDSEHIIRDEFLMQKPGEYVVKVPSLPDSEINLDQENNQSNLSKWIKLLF